MPELTFEARKINIETFRVIETWLVATALYVATCSILAALLRRRRAPPGALEVTGMNEPSLGRACLGSPVAPILYGLGTTVAISLLAIIGGLGRSASSSAWL